MHACGIGRRISVYACGIICRIYGMYAAYVPKHAYTAYMRHICASRCRTRICASRRLPNMPHAYACLGTDVLLRYLRVHHV
jgi:hypothetical protein